MTFKLARNCPILKQIKGSKDAVRYERSSETNSFVQVFDCAASAISVNYLDGLDFEDFQQINGLDNNEDFDDNYEDYDFDDEMYLSYESDEDNI
jgi:hypothetical protein